MAQDEGYVTGTSATRWLCPKCRKVAVLWEELGQHMRRCDGECYVSAVEGVGKAQEPENPAGSDE